MVFACSGKIKSFGAADGSAKMQRVMAAARLYLAGAGLTRMLRW